MRPQRLLSDRRRRAPPQTKRQRRRGQQSARDQNPKESKTASMAFRRGKAGPTALFKSRPYHTSARKPLANRHDPSPNSRQRRERRERKNRVGQVLVSQRRQETGAANRHSNCPPALALRQRFAHGGGPCQRHLRLRCPRRGSRIARKFRPI